MSDTDHLNQETIDAFVVASHHDLPKVQEMLAAQPALLNESATWMETPLGAAAHTANRPIAEFLLAQGAPMDICTAAMLGQTDEVTAFLDDDPNLINATGAHNIPLLYHAVIGGNGALVELLVERGAPLNDGVGTQTALHGAAGFGLTNLVQFLLDQGADFMALDHDGRTPLDVAENAGQDAAAALLRNYTGME